MPARQAVASREAAAPSPFRPVFYGRSPRTSGRHLLEAVSTDGLWAYKRMEDTATLWVVGLIPAGLIVPMYFATLRDARLWTGRPDTLDVCAANLDRYAAGHPDPTRREEAAASLAAVHALRAGTLVVAVPSHRCGSCEGLLAETPDGWRHVAACRPGCWEPADGLAWKICLTPQRHTHCVTPYPGECVHGGCCAVADPAGACDRAEDSRCCGCCRRAERGRP